MKKKDGVIEVDLFNSGGAMYIIGNYFVDYYDNRRNEDGMSQAFRYVKKEDVKKALEGKLDHIQAYVGRIGGEFSDAETDAFDTGLCNEDGETGPDLAAFHIGCKEFGRHEVAILRKWTNSPDERLKFWEKVVQRLGVARVTASGLNRIPNPEDRDAIRNVLKAFKKKAKRAAA